MGEWKRACSNFMDIKHIKKKKQNIGQCFKKEIQHYRYDFLN